MSNNLAQRRQNTRFFFFFPKISCNIFWLMLLTTSLAQDPKTHVSLKAERFSWPHLWFTFTIRPGLNRIKLTHSTKKVRKDKSVYNTVGMKGENPLVQLAHELHYFNVTPFCWDFWPLHLHEHRNSLFIISIYHSSIFIPLLEGFSNPARKKRHAMWQRLNNKELMNKSLVWKLLIQIFWWKLTEYNHS